MRKATKFETLQVLHSLWVHGQVDIQQIKHILLSMCQLHLTSLTNEGISAETLKGGTKFKMK